MNAINVILMMLGIMNNGMVIGKVANFIFTIKALKLNEYIAISYVCKQTLR